MNDLSAKTPSTAKAKTGGRQPLECQVMMDSPLQGSTITLTIDVDVRFGRWFHVRRRLGFWLLWIGYRILGARVETEYVGQSEDS